MKAVIPAAGHGTRMKPISHVICKELLPILNKPILEYIIDEILNSGISEIIIIINKNKESIRHYFSNHYERRNECHISFLYQETQLGLGDAILTAKSEIDDEYFVVVLPDNLIKCENDTPVLKRIINANARFNLPVLSLESLNPKQAHLRAVVDVQKMSDELFTIKGITEKPKILTNESIFSLSGRYVLSIEIFDYILMSNVINQEVNLTDALNTLLVKTKALGVYHSELRYDTGDISGYIEAFTAFAKV